MNFALKLDTPEVREFLVTAEKRDYGPFFPLRQTELGFLRIILKLFHIFFGMNNEIIMFTALRMSVLLMFLMIMKINQQETR